MRDQDQPNIAKDLMRIHEVITRALEVSTRNCHEILTKKTDTPEGLLDYVGTFATILKAHHELEDELAFPYFRDKLKEMPFAKLQEDHQKMHEELGKIIPVEEHKRLAVEHSQHGMKRAQPPFLVVPFLLYNLKPDSRKAMSKPMPALLTMFIMPVMWRQKWIKMKPYLL